MFIGTQLHAPTGFNSLEVGVTYYYAGRILTKAKFVWFSRTKHSWRVFIRMLSVSEFELGLSHQPPLIAILKTPMALPPWLDEVGEINYESLEDRRYEGKTKTYREQVEGRLKSVICLLEKEEEVLQSPNSLKLIAQIAKASEVHVHPHRLQLWFFAYILHGHDIWALKQPTHNVGKWERAQEKHRLKRFGLPHPEGDDYGWPSYLMSTQIIKSYKRRRGLGITMKAIYTDAVRLDFGCKFIETSDGKWKCFHPDGDPFPSYGQFRYRILQNFTLDEVQTARLGAATVKQKATVEKGNVTERLANLLEKVEVDAYFLKERPKSMISNDVMPPLVVARGICATSGEIVGIGFSLGAENADAYRSLLFSMCVPKTMLEQIYGFQQGALNWIAQGLPGNLTSDRGPGGSKKLVADDLKEAFPTKNIVASYNGQGKPVIEASNPHTDSLDGAPTYIQSNLNVVQMMKREVIRASSHNHRADISHRLNDEAINDFVEKKLPATPHNFWKYLSEKMRTDARHMTVAQAVRTFLPRIEILIDNHGLRYRHHYYSSPEFKDSGLHEDMLSAREIKFVGYYVPLTMGYIWVDLRGHLFMLKAVRRMATDTEDTMLSLEETNQSEANLKKLKAITRLSTQAASGAERASFKDETGKEWSSGGRVAGTPKSKNARIIFEFNTIKGKTLGRKSM